MPAYWSSKRRQSHATDQIFCFRRQCSPRVVANHKLAAARIKGRACLQQRDPETRHPDQLNGETARESSYQYRTPSAERHARYVTVTTVAFTTGPMVAAR